MINRLSHVAIHVLDQDRALRFYTEALGFEVRSDISLDGFRWLTVGPRDQPEVEVALLHPSPPPVPADDAQALQALVAKGSLPGIIFHTDDCRAVFERVRDAGAEVLQEPIEQSYGVIDCAFRDPSGNHIRIGQALPVAAG